MKKFTIGAVLIAMLSADTVDAGTITFGKNSTQAAISYSRNIGPRYRQYAVAMYGIFASVRAQLSLMSEMKNLSAVKSTIVSTKKGIDLMETFFYGLAMDLQISKQTSNGTRAVAAVPQLLDNLNRLAGNKAVAPFILKIAATLEGLRLLISELGIPTTTTNVTAQQILKIYRGLIQGLVVIKNSASMSGEEIYDDASTSMPLTRSRTQMYAPMNNNLTPVNGSSTTSAPMYAPMNNNLTPVNGSSTTSAPMYAPMNNNFTPVNGSPTTSAPMYAPTTYTTTVPIQTYQQPTYY